MTEYRIVGDCNICYNSLDGDCNYALTQCKHLFCLSCLLKWYKINPNANCPMCRQKFYDDLQDSQEENDEFEVILANVEEIEQEITRRIIQDMNFNEYDKYKHQFILSTIESNVQQYCIANPMCTYVGKINIYNTENFLDIIIDIDRIDVGLRNPNSYYIIELNNDEYKFGRIESIFKDYILVDIVWVIFRELISINNPENVSWSDNTKYISPYDIKSLKQYVPKIRANV